MFQSAVDISHDLNEIGKGKLWIDGVGNHFTTKEIIYYFERDKKLYQLYQDSKTSQQK